MSNLSAFPNLPIEGPGSQPRSARVCIATYEILGPSQGGGIGTAYFSLATALAAAGHHVTILYLSGEPLAQDESEHWSSRFRTRGIEFMPLSPASRTIDVPNCMLTARDAYAWLRKQQFDVVHFPELRGYGYYSVLAKHQGLDFDHTTLCVGTHSPISWIREQNNEAPYSPDELEMDFMERQCVALADVVVSPSQYMLRWMRARGWTLPSVCYVQQNIAPPELQAVPSPARRGSGVERPAEMVFFGKLEERKGIGLFCDALDRLASQNLSGFSVTFLGKNGRVSGRDALSYIRARAGHWRVPYQVLTDHGHEAALRFLSEEPGRVAIIPSLEDNLPNTVLECLAGGIPFLASGAGGIPELIADSDVERVTFAPDASELADRLARALRDGVPIARPAIDADENKQRWVNWHAVLASRDGDSERAKTNLCVAPASPRVTVYLNYHGRPELLRHSLESLQRQTWPTLEVVLSDCSTAGTEARSEVDGLRFDFESKGWRIIRRAKSDSGAARTSGAANARGDYVLLMDAADCLDRGAVATFVNVATRTGADILTCFLALFTGAREPTQESGLGHYPFLGGALLPGVFRNHFGSGIIFAHKDVLARVEQPRGDCRPDCAQWEFLARAALMGCRLEVIPLPLAWYRIRDNSGPHVPIEYNDQVRAVTPYAESMPADLRDLPKAALTMKLHYERLYGLAHERLGDSAALTMIQKRLSTSDKSNGVSLLDDEGLLLLIVKEMPARARKSMASALDAWLGYSSTRSHLPPSRLRRIPRIARELFRGHYHRFAHGFGSALRDLRRPPKPR
jgi:glycosyltransferase involved in cell wall biosynthesis